MSKPIVIIGLGEMGSVFARGFLRTGHPIYPITREMSIRTEVRNIPPPKLVLVAVAEGDLAAVLEQIPPAWADRLCLLQNELLPQDWAAFEDPTVISVWFEKKQGMDSKVIIPSPVFGPQEGLVAEALNVIGIPARLLNDAGELLFELVVKNLYILTSNIAGLKVGGTVGELWENHREFATQVANEVINIQEALTQRQFDHERLIQAMVTAFEGDPAHKCMGRSAPARLQRALEHEFRFHLKLPTLQDIASHRPG
ncbi:ketopantoate reductase family protein [Pseudomonadota bacterium]